MDAETVNTPSHGYGRFALRDGIIAALALVGWALFSDVSAERGPVGDFAGVVLGGGLGAVAYFMHEWGHMAGGWLGGSVMRPGPDPRRFSNFVYDSRANSRWQFLLMSFSGFAMTALALWGFYQFLPEGEMATDVARGIIWFLVFLGVVLELPLVIWSLVSKKLPPVDGALSASGKAQP